MPDSGPKRMTSFMIEPDLLVWVDEEAREADRSRSWMLNEIVREARMVRSERRLLSQVRPSTLRPASTDTFPSPDVIRSAVEGDYQRETFEGTP